MAREYTTNATKGKCAKETTTEAVLPEVDRTISRLRTFDVTFIENVLFNTFRTSRTLYDQVNI